MNVNRSQTKLFVQKSKWQQQSDPNEIDEKKKRTMFLEENKK